MTMPLLRLDDWYAVAQWLCGSMMCYVGVRHEYMLMTRDTMSSALVTVPA